jgi:hypothetical protein
MLKDRCFVVFGEDYGRHPHCLEHVMNRLLDENRIIWVETMGLRTPRLSLHDLRRSVEKVSGWFRTRHGDRAGRREHPHLTVLAPIMLPFSAISLVRRFNAFSVCRRVNGALAKLGCDDPIFIASVPNACDYVAASPYALRVYYCVDEYSLWPGLAHDLVGEMEDSLLASVDLLCVTSEALGRSKSRIGLPAHLLTHGVDPEHFDLSRLAAGSDQAGPITVTYFGLFDERSDQELIAFLAERNPEVRFLIVGRVAVGVQRLNAFQNVVFHDAVAYQRLPELLSSTTAFFLPYKVDDLSKHINPLKLKEYLATRRPVIASALPEVVKLDRYLHVASDHAEFDRRIKELCAGSLGSAPVAGLDDFLTAHSWAAKAEQLSSWIEERI